MVATTPKVEIPKEIETWVRARGGDHAILLITVDAFLRPHVAMLARDEVVVMSERGLRVAVGEKSRTDENLRLRSSATLSIYDAGLACVIKTRSVVGPRPLLRGIVAHDLAVEDVRFDVPSTSEASARLVTGLRFEGRPERNDIRESLRRLG